MNWQITTIIVAAIGACTALILTGNGEALLWLAVVAWVLVCARS